MPSWAERRTGSVVVDSAGDYIWTAVPLTLMASSLSSLSNLNHDRIALLRLLRVSLSQRVLSKNPSRLLMTIIQTFFMQQS